MELLDQHEIQLVITERELPQTSGVSLLSCIKADHPGIRTRAGALRGRARRAAPGGILLEASTDSEWVARRLEGFGHEVIVADPNFAEM